ncbi:MAG: Mrp/NBP35 family ATP-binding protein [Propionibacteriaceae bacterium]|nr:Mrp/NBP35 family ATP-binding protein [Propionibacteriaceae bacterium]
MTDSHPLLVPIRSALSTVMDPELGKSITELAMVGDIEIDEVSRVTVTLLLTTAGCPLKTRFVTDITEAVLDVSGVSAVDVKFGEMNEEQRANLRTQLGGAGPVIPFAQVGNLTRVIAIASGKGGVGKSSISVNLAVSLSELGHAVGLIDADIYGHSVPDLLGIGDEEGPITIEGIDLVIPVEAHGIKVMSIGMMKPSRDQVVAWRGPVVDRAVSQFLTDVHWGDLDFLIVDLPPGTGDTAIGFGQKLPNAEVIVVTTPQVAATEVAERAGTMADTLGQKVIGVVENMSYLDTECPQCSHSHRVELFGSGGGTQIATTLSERLEYEVPVLAQIPLDVGFREDGDQGTPTVLFHPSSPTATALRTLAEKLASQPRGLAGKRLNLSTAAQTTASMD